MALDDDKFDSLIQDLTVLKRVKAMFESYHVEVMRTNYQPGIQVEVRFSVYIPPGVKINITDEQKELNRG